MLSWKSLILWENVGRGRLQDRGFVKQTKNMICTKSRLRGQEGQIGDTFVCFFAIFDDFWSIVFVPLGGNYFGTTAKK